jgi:hypothetical protein
VTVVVGGGDVVVGFVSVGGGLSASACEEARPAAAIRTSTSAHRMGPAAAIRFQATFRLLSCDADLLLPTTGRYFLDQTLVKEKSAVAGSAI